MPRTAKNIYKRKDGRWEARYPVGKKENGNTKYASLYARSYSEAKELLQKAQISRITPPPKKILFSEVLEKWITVNDVNHKPATKLKYEYLIETHISPELGGYSVGDINESLINEFVRLKMTSGRIDKHGGLSGNYVKTMLIIIQSALDYAVEQEWCPKLKSQIAKPPVDQKNIVILNPSELDLLENGLSADSSLESIGIMLSLYIGLRIGEICALRWSDIDLENRVLHVRHTIARIKNTDPEDSAKTRLVIDKPKTKSSLRDIPITTKIFALLTSARATSISEYVISDQSTFLSPRTYEYRFHKKLKEHNIKDVNYHALRHTFATRCIEKGIDVKSLSEILGHSNVSITLNTYVHSSMELKRSQLEKLN